MKFKLFLAAIIAGLFFTSCDLMKEGSGDDLEFASYEDTLSYLIGCDMASNLTRSGIEVNPDVFIKGYKDALDSNEYFTEEEMQAFFTAYTQKQQQKQMEEQQAKMAEASQQAGPNKEVGAKFLADNKGKDGVKETESGLQYKVLKQGNGPKPVASDKVKVHYKGSLIDGTVFDSSYDRGEPIEFPLANVIPGWTEGLQLMNVGSKCMLYIPSDLGYGDNGNPRIPGGSTLIFEVELLDIIK